MPPRPEPRRTCPLGWNIDTPLGLLAVQCRSNAIFISEPAAPRAKELGGDAMTAQRFCTNCGSGVDPASTYCGNCGSPIASPTGQSSPPPTLGRSSRDAAPEKPRRGLRILVFLAIVAAVVVWLTVVAQHGTSSGSAPDSASDIDSGSSSSSVELPASEQSFISTVSAAQSQSRNVDNDMQRGGVKAARDRSLCTQMGSLQVTDWVGTVGTIDSNSDGKGVLAVQVAPDITVETWNNALSDIGSDTLIEPGSPVFQAASAMKQGALVRFSGTFLPGDDGGDCLREGSLTLEGKVESPDFIFRFSSIAPYTAASPTSTTTQQSSNSSNADSTLPTVAPLPSAQTVPVSQDTPQAQQTGSALGDQPSSTPPAIPATLQSGPQVTAVAQPSTPEQLTPVASSPADSGNSPQLSGVFTGVVHNETARLSSVFSIQVQDTSGSLSGCMIVDPPLTGSGKLQGTATGDNVSFVVISTAGRISFTGQLTQQGTISGTYTVQHDNGMTEDGAFTLRRGNTNTPAMNCQS